MAELKCVPLYMACQDGVLSLCIVFQSEMVQVLLFADDLVVCSSSEEELSLVLRLLIAIRSVFLQSPMRVLRRRSGRPLWVPDYRRWM